MGINKQMNELAHFHKWMKLWAMLRLYFKDIDFFRSSSRTSFYIVNFMVMKGVVI